MEIVEQCKGVPLALRAIGSVLFERTEAEWLKVKDNVPQYITQQENSIMPILKLSYDHLPPHLKQCFAYCSLIPKDTEILVEQLIIQWMAQGFIQQLSSGDEDLEDVGHKYFMDLLWGSFFQVKEKDVSGNVVSFTMHDLMHDLAFSVAGTEYCIASLGAENINERTRHASFEDQLDSSWKIPRTFLKALKIRTILPIRSGYLNQFTCSALISTFKYLRMLNLRYLHVEMLPDSIGELKHLRALDLSHNYDLKKLPSSLCRLQNLQTLSLNGCYNLEKLPRKISRLVSLRYLYIYGCDKLAYMPRGLGKLTCLRKLDKFVVGKTVWHGDQLRELTGLKNLKGELHISSLENANPEPGSSCLKAKLSLKSLILNWSRRGSHNEIVLECLQPHPNLEKLQVCGFPGSKIPSWFCSLMKLTELRLVNCFKCKHLAPLHQLCSLKSLELSNLKALENVLEIEKQKELTSAKSKTILSSLEILKLQDCPNLKGWWRGDVVEASNAQPPCFPCLSMLNIVRCPNLTSMPLFPSVKSMYLTETSWNWKPLQQTMRLKMTTLEASSSSLSSPYFPPFCKLQEMRLCKMDDLDSLPEEFLQNPTSLQSLCIERCINLTSMPEGMRRLTSLRKLIINDCPHLSKRCERDIGVDWFNIAHIETILLDGRLFLLEDGKS